MSPNHSYSFRCALADAAPPPLALGGRPRLRGGSPSKSRMNAAIPLSPALPASLACSSGVTGSRMSMVAGTCAFRFGFRMGRNVTRDTLARKPGLVVIKCGDNSIVPGGKGGYDSGMNNGTADSRFFPGYIWVSDHADCMRGLCYQSSDERAAAEWMAPKGYWLKGKTFAVFTKTEPYDVPQRHMITR